MITWNFNVADYEESSFKPIPVGEHRVRIANAEEQVSNNSGNQMIKLTLDVSGHNGSLWHYIVFMPENQKLTNQKLGEVFNSFGIQPGNFNLTSWINKVGACKVKHEQYNGEVSAKVAWFIAKDKQGNLPAWKEPSNKAAVTGQATQSDMVEINVDDLPWG